MSNKEVVYTKYEPMKFFDKNSEPIAIDTAFKSVNTPTDHKTAEFLEDWDRTKPDLGVMKIPS